MAPSSFEEIYEGMKRTLKEVYMKIGKKKLKMSSGEVRNFKSERARDNFERVAQAVKYGWKPTHNNDTFKMKKRKKG